MFTVKTHRKRSGIEMNETLNLHRQRTKWTADIELDNIWLNPNRVGLLDVA